MYIKSEPNSSNSIYAGTEWAAPHVSVRDILVHRFDSGSIFCLFFISVLDSVEQVKIVPQGFPTFYATQGFISMFSISRHVYYVLGHIN